MDVYRTRNRACHPPSESRLAVAAHQQHQLAFHTATIQDQPPVHNEYNKAESDDEEAYDANDEDGDVASHLVPRKRAARNSKTKPGAQPKPTQLGFYSRSPYAAPLEEAKRLFHRFIVLIEPFTSISLHLEDAGKCLKEAIKQFESEGAAVNGKLLFNTLYT